MGAGLVVLTPVDVIICLSSFLWSFRESFLDGWALDSVPFLFMLSFSNYILM